MPLPIAHAHWFEAFLCKVPGLKPPVAASCRVHGVARERIRGNSSRWHAVKTSSRKGTQPAGAGVELGTLTEEVATVVAELVGTSLSYDSPLASVGLDSIGATEVVRMLGD